jgi:hypothetical protein
MLHRSDDTRTSSATVEDPLYPFTSTTATSVSIHLDEQYVPHDCLPGEGFIPGTFVYDSWNGRSLRALECEYCLAGTLVGQATLGDSTVVENEYRNFQIRIVQDLTAPTAVNQRRIIASHTAGPSPVYTLGTNWTVTPSSSAKYVIEFPNLVLVRNSQYPTMVFAFCPLSLSAPSPDNGTSQVITLQWNGEYFANSPGDYLTSGMWIPCWGVRPGADKAVRHSYIYFLRDGVLDLFDIAGGTGGAWTANVEVFGGPMPAGQVNGAYAPFPKGEGRNFYLSSTTPAGEINRMFQFDVATRTLYGASNTFEVQTDTAFTGNMMAAFVVTGGGVRREMLIQQVRDSTMVLELLPMT